MVYGKDLTAGVGVFWAGGMAVGFGGFATVTVFSDLAGGAALTAVVAVFLSWPAVAGFGVFTVAAGFCDLTDAGGLACFGAACPPCFADGVAGRSAEPASFVFSPGDAGPSSVRAFSEAFWVDWAAVVLGLAE